MMNLDAIAVFIKVAQYGSFTKAAKLLGMPVSTVSFKVSSLEKNLGITLLLRTTRKLEITEAGETYFKGCSQALEEIRAVEAQLSMKQDEPHGNLKITAPIDIGNTLLPEIVQGFLSRYKQMNVELLITNQIMDLVEEGVDLAIRGGTLKDSSLIVKKFMTEQLSLWASPSYLEKRGTPSHPNELVQHEFIRYSFEKDKTLKLSNGNETVTITTQGRIFLNSAEAAKKLTLVGQGIGLLHNFLCNEEVKEGRIVKVLPEWYWLYLPYHFVYPPQRFISPKVRIFINFAEEYMKRSYSQA